ncbi:MAG: nucleotidyltransferase domain-containing protein [Armatimonadetes bacterium]|nr:nucleotidyltransferase domain-containing protein [Armatimonadota bacterium]
MGLLRDGLREVQPQLNAYLSRLRGRIPVRSAVLFGSRARGQHWETSDIDLLVVSSAFNGLSRGERFDLLLADWSGIPALEPFGCTPPELLGHGSLLLWDALHQGRVLLDDGVWQAARQHFDERLERGDLTPTRRGWKERLEDSG